MKRGNLERPSGKYNVERTELSLTNWSLHGLTPADENQYSPLVRSSLSCLHLYSEKVRTSDIVGLYGFRGFSPAYWPYGSTRWFLPV
jgi:hypothetical protein